MTEDTFTVTRRDGTTYQVRALTPPFWGPFGESVTCEVLTGEWSGRVLDIQTSDLIATS